MKFISIIAVLALILMAGIGSARSGDGAMTVNPTSVTAGSIGNNLIFTFNNQAHTFSSGSQATITIPSLWTAPQKTNSGGNGYVSVIANGATSVTYSISGQTITVYFITTNSPNKGFTINYNKVNAPEKSGSYTFITKTKGDGSGSFKNINTQPTVKVNPASASVFVVSGFPSPITAGFSRGFTVTAKDAYGNTATGYTGKVHFTSSDGQAVLPPDTRFIVSDRGIHSFYARLKTAGSQWLKATDNANSAITGSQTIMVKPDRANKLAFTSQPSDTSTGYKIYPSVEVQLWDQYNNLVIDRTALVTVSIGSNPGSGTLRGTKSQKTIQGVATFNDLSIDKAGAGYTLKASSGGLSSATSNKFDITAIYFEVSGFPSPTTAGDKGNFMVRAKYANGNTATDYTGKVHFTSSDGRAELPPDTTIVASDNGIHWFHAILKTKGIQWLEATDMAKYAIHGSQTGIIVETPIYTHTITPSPMVGSTVTAAISSTSTTGTKMQFIWKRPSGHTARTYYDTTRSLPPSPDWEDFIDPDIAGTWKSIGNEFDGKSVKLGTSEKTFEVTENPEFGKLGAVLPLFAVGFIYMNYRKKLNK